MPCPAENFIYNCSVKKFSDHGTIPLAAFRCERVSPGLTERFSNPTTTIFQYWVVIPDIVVPIFLEKPVISPTYIRWLPGCDMSHILHPSRIEFAILLIVQYHYIWWSIPFQIANPKVMVSYINLKFQILQKKSRLHFPVLHIAGDCAMLT